MALRLCSRVAPELLRWRLRRSSSRERNGVTLLVLGVVVGSRNLEAAARSLTTVAPLVDGHARYLCDQSLGHATHLGVVRCQCGQGAAVALDDISAVPLFELRETAQLV